MKTRLNRSGDAVALVNRVQDPMLTCLCVPPMAVAQRGASITAVPDFDRRVGMRQKPRTSKFIGTPVTKAYRPNKGHCSGMLYSFKNQEQRPWRGLLERDAMILWDVDPEVESFLVEPLKIPYVRPSGRPSHYTPDRLVHFHGTRPTLLVEIKPGKHLRRKRAIWKAKFAAARAHAQAQGWEFEVWTEKQIRGPQYDNAYFLREFLNHPVNAMAHDRLMGRLAELGTASIADLLGQVALDETDRLTLIPQLWQCIVMHKIRADWKKPITIYSRVTVAEGGASK